jgi:hypothetical protein
MNVREAGRLGAPATNSKLSKKKAARERTVRGYRSLKEK